MIKIQLTHSIEWCKGLKHLDELPEKKHDFSDYKQSNWTIPIE